MHPVSRPITEGSNPSIPSSQSEFGKVLNAAQDGRETFVLPSQHTPPIPQHDYTLAASQDTSSTFVFGQPSLENPAAFTFRASGSTYPRFLIEDYDTGATRNLSEGINPMQDNHVFPSAASDPKIHLNTLLHGPGNEAQTSPFTDILGNLHKSITPENSTLTALQGEGNEQGTPEANKRTVEVPLRRNLTPQETKAAELAYTWVNDQNFFPKFLSDGLNEGGM
jgi:hypothetical protein